MSKEGKQAGARRTQWKVAKRRKQTESATIVVRLLGISRNGEQLLDESSILSGLIRKGCGRRGSPCKPCCLGSRFCGTRPRRARILTEERELFFNRTIRRDSESRTRGYRSIQPIELRPSRSSSLKAFHIPEKTCGYRNYYHRRGILREISPECVALDDFASRNRRVLCNCS